MIIDRICDDAVAEQYSEDYLSVSKEQPRAGTVEVAA